MCYHVHVIQDSRLILKIDSQGQKYHWCKIEEELMVTTYKWCDKSRGNDIIWIVYCLWTVVQILPHPSYYLLIKKQKYFPFCHYFYPLNFNGLISFLDYYLPLSVHWYWILMLVSFSEKCFYFRSRDATNYNHSFSSLRFLLVTCIKENILVISFKGENFWYLCYREEKFSESSNLLARMN